MGLDWSGYKSGRVWTGLDVSPWMGLDESGHRCLDVPGRHASRETSSQTGVSLDRLSGDEKMPLKDSERTNAFVRKMCTLNH